MASIIKADNIQKVSDGSNIIKKCGSTITLGSCGATISLACGATQTGFGRTGTVDWCTTAKTAPFTGVSGNGYFVNTTCGAVTVTLPATPTAGDIISIADYASTFQTNNLTLCRNGSLINGGAFNSALSTEGQSITLVYVDGTRGWKNTMDSTSNVSGVPNFIVATGGTITCCGDYKIHTFTADGTFTICTAPTPANNNVSYVVVAGGGASGQDQGAGGGAGGYREGKHSTDPYTASPLAATPCSSLPVSVQSYPVTVGAGGAGSPYSSPVVPGNNSIFSTITSAGGGGGGSQGPAPGKPGQAGGSGGGGSEASGSYPGGAGNTPPVSPPQGNAGGSNSNSNYGGGGGGAGEAGNTDGGGHGGDGVASSITGSSVFRAGGGSSGATPNTPAGIAGGDGGGGTGAYPGTSGSPTVNGTANTGGGAGGATGYFGACYTAGSSGGSGIVIIRYKYQ
jgi:hypothetical protein